VSALVSEFLAGQLRKPSGFFGRLVTSRLLNRANVAINQATLASLALQPDDRVLEVGFGAGDLISRLAPIVVEGSIAGVDFSPDMVELCTRRFASLVRAGRVDLRCASAESLPYDADRFTKACTVNTVYFWADPAVPLNELWRVLRVGGRLVLAFSPRATMQKLPVTKHGFRLYDPDEIGRLLEEAGFGGVEMTPGSGPRGEFVCATGTKFGARAV
jgi:ubiquinone/menaquinone biosynthesis C-methylase UbiE